MHIRVARIVGFKVGFPTRRDSPKTNQKRMSCCPFVPGQKQEEKSWYKSPLSWDVPGQNRDLISKTNVEKVKNCQNIFFSKIVFFSSFLLLLDCQNPVSACLVLKCQNFVLSPVCPVAKFQNPALACPMANF